MPAEDNILKHRLVKTNTSVSGEDAIKIRNKKISNKQKEELHLRNKYYQHHRLWSRAFIVILVFIIVYFYSKQKQEKRFAVINEHLPLRIQKFPCSTSYKNEIEQYPKCVPNHCGRFVSDKLIENHETQMLLQMAQSILNLTGSNGGASILDIHSGALSHGDKFINVYQMPQAIGKINSSHLVAYNMIKSKIKLAIAENFGIDSAHLYLTYPTFFSKINNNTAKTVHDEYWHEHVDKETYPSFHYTSLLYFTTQNKDYKGGRFVFVDVNEKENRLRSYIEPKQGRVLAFTSGAENRHYVEKVTEGVRYALTVSFTCDQQYKIDDPKFPTATSME